MFNSYRYQSQPRITGFRWKTSLLFGVPDHLINRIGIVIIRADDLFGERLHACRAPTNSWVIESALRLLCGDATTATATGTRTHRIISPTFAIATILYGVSLRPSGKAPHQESQKFHGPDVKTVYKSHVIAYRANALARKYDGSELRGRFVHAPACRTTRLHLAIGRASLIGNR